MTAHELLATVRVLRSELPLHKALERDLKIGPGYGNAWYRSQKEHWIKWLSDYDTPGPYGRHPRVRTSAEVIYNRLMCPPMVFWLAEASGVSGPLLRDAHQAALSARPHCASQTSAIRQLVPWCGVTFTLSSNGRFIEKCCEIF